VAEVPDSDGLPPSGWKIYEVVGGDALVTPLAFQPVVLQGVDAADGWLKVSTAWFNDPDALARPLVASGPADWQRAPGSDARAAGRVDLPPVTVSDIRSDDHSISFHVSQTGVPVLVKTSYFPNWRATGAKGPWRSTPNYMVVVPTSNDVRLVYEQTSAEWMGLGGSILGLVGLVALALFFGSASRRRRHSGDVLPSTSEPVVVGAAADTAPATTAVTAPATDGDEPAPEPFDGPNRERTGPGLP
jgi:hypothetical protein